MTALLFLESNGFDEDLEDFAVKAATDKLGVAAIAAWLEEYSAARS